MGARAQTGNDVCVIRSSSGNSLELRNAAGMIPPGLWFDFGKSKASFKALREHLSGISEQVNVSLSIASFGRNSRVDKNRQQLFSVFNDELIIHSGQGNHFAFSFRGPGVEHFQLEKKVVNPILGTQVKSALCKQYSSDSMEAMEFLKCLHAHMLDLDRDIVLIESIKDLIRAILPDSPKKVVQHCYHAWFLKQELIVYGNRSECGSKAIKVNVKHLSTLVETMLMEQDMLIAESSSFDITTNSFSEEIILEEQYMPVNQELQTLFAELFAKRMQVGQKMKDLQARRDEQEAQRVEVRAHLDSQQVQEIQLEKDIGQLQTEVKDCQPILDEVRKDFVQAVKAEAEASSNNLLAFQQDPNLAFIAAQATANRTDAMAKVQEKQGHMDAARLQLQEKQNSYELVKQTRKNLDKQYEELYGEVQQMDRELSQMKIKIQSTLSRKEKPEVVASLELLLEIGRSIIITD